MPNLTVTLFNPRCCVVLYIELVRFIAHEYIRDTTVSAESKHVKWFALTDNVHAQANINIKGLAWTARLVPSCSNLANEYHSTDTVIMLLPRVGFSLPTERRKFELVWSSCWLYTLPCLGLGGKAFVSIFFWLPLIWLRVDITDTFFGHFRGMVHFLLNHTTAVVWCYTWYSQHLTVLLYRSNMKGNIYIQLQR